MTIERPLLHVNAIRLLKYLDRSPLVQFPLKWFILINHYTAMSLQEFASYFDEESKRAKKFRSQALDLLNLEKLALRRRYKYMHLSKSMRLKAAALEVAVKAFELIKLAAAKANELSKQMEPKDPYPLWAQSLDQTTILIAWKDLKDDDDDDDDDDKGEEKKGKEGEKMDGDEGEEDEESDGTAEPLGYIRIDLDAPCSIVREKIRRTLREAMNLKNGEGFLFLVSVSF